MSNQELEEITLNNENIVDENINKQLLQIYLDQERRRKAQDRKRKFLEKWGYIWSCCLD